MADSGMTVTQLHRAAKIDICTVRALIQGARKPQMKTVEALAAALGLEWFFFRKTGA
jgi:transcriptional regulator with XRE-family HTH domain